MRWCGWATQQTPRLRSTSTIETVIGKESPVAHASATMSHEMLAGRLCACALSLLPLPLAPPPPPPLLLLPGLPAPPDPLVVLFLGAPPAPLAFPTGDPLAGVLPLGAVACSRWLAFLLSALLLLLPCVACAVAFVAPALVLVGRVALLLVALDFPAAPVRAGALHLFSKHGSVWFAHEAAKSEQQSWCDVQWKLHCEGLRRVGAARQNHCARSGPDWLGWRGHGSLASLPLSLTHAPLLSCPILLADTTRAYLASPPVHHLVN
jgi:hypothetical protein